MCKMNEDMNLTKFEAEAGCPQYDTVFKCSCSSVIQTGKSHIPASMDTLDV